VRALSVPELATSITATRKGRLDVALARSTLMDERTDTSFFYSA